MITNLGRIRRRHKWLLGQMRQGIDMSLRDMGNDAVDFMAASPGFNAHGRGPGTALGSVTKRVMRLKSGAKMVFRNTAKHAVWLEKGTPPHLIKARRAAFLHFFWPKAGRWIRTRSVNHPGTKAYQFMSRGITKAGGRMFVNLHNRFRFILKRF